MKRKIILIGIIFLLFVGSAFMIFWYFTKVEESMFQLQHAREWAQRPFPEEIAVKVFFGNEKNNPGAANCSAVFPVTRIVKNDLVVRRAAIEELLKGPTTEEKEQGYYSSIPSKEEVIEFREKVKEETGEAPYEGDEVKLKSLKILSGTAYVNFSEELKAYGGGSCKVAAIKAEISETLKQFPRVDGVIISIEGDEHALQP